jgi:hypothetical protein
MGRRISGGFPVLLIWQCSWDQGEWPLYRVAVKRDSTIIPTGSVHYH